MKEFISHIDYLIQKHDCVIIPGFGGFVISHEGSLVASDGTILPPKVSIGFNPDLKSNDGLLAESYMTMYSIPYDEACRRIEESVRRLRTILGMKHPVQIGRLGKLSLNNNRLTFIPNANLSVSHPDTFGLSTVNMRRLADIEKDKLRAGRRSVLKRVLAGAGAAAAAVLIFFIASTPVSENNEAQKSGILSDWISSLPGSSDNSSEPAENNPVSVTEAESISEENETSVSGSEVNTSAPEQANVPVEQVAETAKPKPETLSEDNSGNEYYVIIAGATNKADAQRLIGKFKSQGFDNVGAVTSKDRIRIYAASFGSLREAEAYLSEFKRENPRMHDAWVYRKK